MLKSIKFLKDWRCFQPCVTFTFKPGINLLVGDQGCGKSSLLFMIKSDGWLNAYDAYGQDQEKRIAELDVPQGINTYYLDFEKGTTRNLDLETATSMGISTRDFLYSNMVSHGENVLVTAKSLPKATNSVFIMDEPDMALSIRSIYILYTTILDRAKDNQVFLSCHNPYLMELVGEVYSIEHNQWMTFEEFKSKMISS